MPLDLEGKIRRNLEILGRLWAKKQSGRLSGNQRDEVRHTIRAIRTNRRASNTEREAREWIGSLRKKSLHENRLLGIPGYHLRDYQDNDGSE